MTFTMREAESYIQWDATYMYILCAHISMVIIYVFGGFFFKLIEQ